MSGKLVIDAISTLSHQTKQDPVVEIWYEYPKKITIKDPGQIGYYTSYFWVKNLLSIPIILNGVHISADEKPSEYAVTPYFRKTSSNNWEDHLAYDNLGSISPNTWSRRYSFQFTIEYTDTYYPLPADYISSLSFSPKYTVDYGQIQHFIFDSNVVKG
ncbi:MAG: hypothetical protein F6K58_06110 [Symploca sp. SIO2E9]|nr:hypothetical protein [Symploca sp. SIO2E9]